MKIVFFIILNPLLFCFVVYYIQLYRKTTLFSINHTHYQLHIQPEHGHLISFSNLIVFIHSLNEKWTRKNDISYCLFKWKNRHLHPLFHCFSSHLFSFCWLFSFVLFFTNTLLHPPPNNSFNCIFKRGLFWLYRVFQDTLQDSIELYEPFDSPDDISPEILHDPGMKLSDSSMMTDSSRSSWLAIVLW